MCWQSTPTMESALMRFKTEQKARRNDRESRDHPNWSCVACTLVHILCAIKLNLFCHLYISGHLLYVGWPQCHARSCRWCASGCHHVPVSNVWSKGPQEDKGCLYHAALCSLWKSLSGCTLPHGEPENGPSGQRWGMWDATEHVFLSTRSTCVIEMYKCVCMWIEACCDKRCHWDTYVCVM